MNPKPNKLSPKREIVVSEAVIRPTGLLDPEIILKPVANQVDDILEEIRQRVIKNQRVLITTLTKKFAEELDLYLKQINIASAYIHSDVETLNRLDILADLRRGKYDVLIGINLLREGLDLPEVSLVAIFDADKEGFLRSRTSLIQIVGRAARHEEGKVIMYADKLTKSMNEAISETNRRRKLQSEYNLLNHIIPKSTTRELKTIADDVRDEIKKDDNYGKSNVTYEIGKGFVKIEDFEINNINSKSINPTKSGKRPKAVQAYDSFDTLKTQLYNELKGQNLTEEQLKKKLKEATLEYNFELAAAVRDYLKSEFNK
jgi:excinuclease ABC subunit B